MWVWSMVIMGMGMTAPLIGEGERQLTFGPSNHMLDDNDNFSPNSRHLVYDTREVIGPGIEHSQSIESVEIATGATTVLYAPTQTQTGAAPAPGIGAVSHSPVRREVAFIHGPLVSEVPVRGPYGKTNRRGAVVPADGSQRLSWLDYRDVDTSRPTLPGAHRGGTHRHEYTRNGRRIGFTYDDHLLPQFGRAIGYMEAHRDAPGDASHWFAILVSVVPEGEARPGDIVRAYGDSWVDSGGTMRAFIGQVMEEDGSFQESLFVVDIPREVDITTAFAGSATEYPAPPEGVRVRRLTHEWAGGIVRGSPDGRRIAYYAEYLDGSTQVFLIPSDGSDQHPDSRKHPELLSSFQHGAQRGLRWHPTGNSIACISNNGVAVVNARPGSRFGATHWLTEQGGDAERSQLVWSPDGTLLAFCKPVPFVDTDGTRRTTYDGSDFTQIFVVDFPDANRNGIVD